MFTDSTVSLHAFSGAGQWYIGPVDDRFYRTHSPFITSDFDMTTDTPVLQKYMCLICGYIYDEAAGVPDEGIAAGTKWEDVPMNWTCPECGARKEDFEMVQI